MDTELAPSPYRVISTAPTGSLEWKLAHKGRIGGSTVADILGVGRNTPLRAWALLTGKLEEEDISNLSYIKRGNALEPVVRRAYVEETGRLVHIGPGLIAHPTLDWLAGTPDGIVQAEGRALAPLEIKTVGFVRKKDWDEGATPISYQTQVAFYAMLMNVDWCAIAGMPIDMDEDTPLIIHRDLVVNPIFADFMMDQLVEFREKHWLTDIPPEGDWEKDRATIKRLFPKEAEGRTVELTDEMIELWALKEQLASQKTQIGNELDATTARIEAYIGDAEYAIGPGWRLKYKQEAVKGYTVEPGFKRQIRKVKGL